MTSTIALEEIVYPVFFLGAEQPKFIDGVAFYARRYIDEDRNETGSISIIDDKNIPALTLAKRRLKLLAMEVKLKKLGKATFFLGDLLKLTKPALWFIDSSGKVFRHTKSKRAKLEFKKIKQLHVIPTGGAIIEVEGIPSRFKSLYAPQLGEQYAGVLKLGMQYILYGVYDTKHQDTWRMI